jgi:hypothetical protein
MNFKKNLLYKTVERVFVIAYPPFGEETLAEIDIRLGLVFKENPEVLLTVSTDLNDVWSPVLKAEQIPAVQFNSYQFEKRISKWMKQEIDDELILEYYEFTNSNDFNDIVGSKIEKIELIMIQGNPEPFGLKVSFKNDFIISLPNSNGNTIETKHFNKNEGLNNFDYLGNVIYSEIK